MRKCLLTVTATLVLVGAFAQPVQAEVVADYTDDFSYPAPAPGWSYLWNANGPIGNAATYVPLVPDGSSPARYETQNQTPDAFPDPAPGSSASATSTTLIPGQGNAQDTIERYVIAAYTLSAADVAAHGNLLSLDFYSFAVSSGSEDGVTARVYRNDIPYVDRDLQPGVTFDYQAPDGGEIHLGPFVAGDTLYIAIGANGVAPFDVGNDVGDVLTVDYSIKLVPEPTSAGALVLGAACFLSRRRRR